MKFFKTTLILSTLIFSASGMAMDKTAVGAVAGAAIGAATGKSVKSTVGGAVVGGGAGDALITPGRAATLPGLPFTRGFFGSAQSHPSRPASA